MQFDHLKRRDFITLLGCTAATWPLATRAQQTGRIPRVAVLTPFVESDPEAQTWFKAFVQGMQALGWTDGRNIRIDVRWAGGKVDRIQSLAKELVGRSWAPSAAIQARATSGIRLPRIVEEAIA
jgi:putative ABC transport system substrate-binding protein